MDRRGCGLGMWNGRILLEEDEVEVFGSLYVNFNGCCHNYICRPLVGTCIRHTSITRFALLVLGPIFFDFLWILEPCFHSIRLMPLDLDSHL